MFLISLCTCGALLSLGPQLNLLVQIDENLNVTAIELLIDGLLLVVILTACTAAFLAMLGTFISAKIVAKFLGVMNIYFIISLINPVIIGGLADMVGYNPHINFMILFLNVLIALMVYVFLIREVNIDPYLALVIFITTGFLASYNFHLDTREPSRHATFGEKNIIVFSFDGISGPVLNELTDLDPDFSSNFKDFTYYKSVISHAPATLSSIFSELFGVHN